MLNEYVVVKKKEVEKNRAQGWKNDNDSDSYLVRNRIVRDK